MALVDSLVVFLGGLIIGALGIYVAANIVTESSYGDAILTALIGALVWGIASFLFGWIPFLGPVLTLLAWLGVIKWRYNVGWLNAGAIALFSWLATLLILYLLAYFNIATFEAIGIPNA